MPRISKNSLAAKNKAGNGLRNNDTGSNRQIHDNLKEADETIRKSGVLGGLSDDQKLSEQRYREELSFSKKELGQEEPEAENSKLDKSFDYGHNGPAGGIQI